MDMIAAIEDLQQENRQIKAALMTALSWIAGSSNSPIRIDEVSKIEEILNGPN